MYIYTRVYRSSKMRRGHDFGKAPTRDKKDPHNLGKSPSIPCMRLRHGFGRPAREPKHPLNMQTQPYVES